MPSSQGGIFIKLIATSRLQQHQLVSSSVVLLRNFCSIRDFNVNNDDNNGTYSNSNNHKTDYEYPPEPIPNRPLRGERPFNHQNQPQRSRQSPLNSNQQQSFQLPNRPRRQPPKLADEAQSDENFLEKFKLAIDNETEKPIQNDKMTATAQIPQQQEHKHNRAQPVTEPPQDADEIFKKMKETGLIPNAVSMLDGLCKDGLVQEAMKLFGLMREKGTIPEVVIYTAVVDGFCKAQKFDDAKRIFRKMQSNGIAPNAFSYTVLIQGLYKSNKLEDAIEYCVEMLEVGHSPNVTTFVGLVDGLCREKGVEEAQSVIATLKQKGFLVNDKAIREFLDKKAPFLPSIWEAIFGKKTSQKPF
ncbi:Pentatricopeptide repeat [Melia azedarach]|uniref:Pentatricopeptide repeat n=2 Tax=Melia azedarach TaxID=155640 RepID=A0ACC1XWI8_MELAZ|nr:Pentatricopeptide repeat [Melia azedarach]KAJ4715795.1 Pentatricopeptide repeat [Melia azedarach]